MTWEHRVCEVIEGDDVYITIKEVIYDDDDNVIGAHDPFLHSENLLGLQELHERMLLALDKPVLPIWKMLKENDDE
jgi:hypothetical protein